MKTWVLTGLRTMALREAPTPALARDTDVLLRMAAVGVCGSDIHYYTAGRIGAQVVRYPFAVGHEGAAVVERVGPAVRRVRPGDRVAIEPAVSCGACDQCRRGRPHTCRRLVFLGCPGQAEGCLSELLAMPETACVPLADGISLEQAALSEPLAIGLYAARRALPLKGAAIAILGAGPIGLSVLLGARLHGAARIYVTDPIAPRRRVAVGAGADWAGDPDGEDIVASIVRQEPMLLDAVFECCGRQSAIDQAVALLRPGGRLMLVGIPETERVAVVSDQARRKELDLRHVRRQCECLAPTLALLERGRLQPEFMVTHRFPFAETPAAFHLVAGYRDGVVKAMIRFE